MLYEKFYAGNSLIVRNQNDREAPWQKFHDTVDGLLARIEVPRRRPELNCSTVEWAVAPCAAPVPAALLVASGLVSARELS